MDRKELYASVTAQIVKQIEDGAGQWKMPWQAIADAGEPVNATTHKAYRGGNHLVLGMVAVGRGWSGNWATYKQWQSIGAQVRNGEKSTFGVKWSVVEDRNNPSENKLVPYTFSVFAAEQVDGYDAPERPELDTPDRIATAELFFATIGADVRHGGNRAFYKPSEDFIQLPELGQFSEAHAYYATAAHEHAHWTGHAARLGRDMAHKFGTKGYAAEELVAELSAAFTCARLGISTTPRPDHAAYLDSWLSILRTDTSALFTATSKAQAATDYLADKAGIEARELVAV